MNNNIVTILVWNLLLFVLINGEENKLQVPKIVQADRVATEVKGEGNVNNIKGGHFSNYDGTQNDLEGDYRDVNPLVRLVKFYLKQSFVGRMKLPTNRSIIPDKSSTLHADIDWKQYNDLTPHPSASRRQIRSINQKDAKIVAEIEEIMTALKQHMDDPEIYRELVAIVRDIQQQLVKNQLAPGKDTFINNILKSYMKRRFNSWGGKRSSKRTAGFNAWGGRRKKSVDYNIGSSGHLMRDTRGFNAWGGKRGFDHMEQGPDRLRLNDEKVGKGILNGHPDNTIFINLDIGSAKAREAVGKATLGKAYDDARTGGFLQSGEEPLAALMYYGKSANPASIHRDFEKKSFNAWGGKRNGIGVTGDHDKLETLTLTKEISNKDVKRKTFNQWGGK